MRNINVIPAIPVSDEALGNKEVLFKDLWKNVSNFYSTRYLPEYEDTYGINIIIAANLVHNIVYIFGFDEEKASILDRHLDGYWLMKNGPKDGFNDGNIYVTPEEYALLQTYGNLDMSSVIVGKKVNFTNAS